MVKKKLKKRTPRGKAVRGKARRTVKKKRATPKKKAAARKRSPASVKKAARKKTRHTVKKKRATPKKKAAARKRSPASVKKAARKKTRRTVKKKRAAPKKKAAVKKRSAASAKKTAKKKTRRTTKRAVVKKKTSKVKKRKVSPPRKKAAKKARGKAERKPAQKKSVTKARARPRAQTKSPPKARARMLKPGENGTVPRVASYQLKKGETYMSPQQLEHFSKLLLNWKKELMREVDKTVSHMQSDATNFADPADRATQEEEFGLELRTRDRERKLIKKIDEALGMMGMDEYGYCSACGAEIGIRRLEARPTATLCIDCKTMQELKERQLAD